MKRKKCQELVKMWWILICLAAVVCGPSVGGILPQNGHNEDRSAVGNLGYQWDIRGPGREEKLKFPDVEEGVPGRRLLSDNETTAAPPEEDKSIWEKIDEFYSDNNNMAMYCVLPIIVLVYGGCSAIYCIYKCRRYLRRRKHKRLTNEDDGSEAGDERNDLNQRGDGGKDGEDRQPIKTVSGEWEDANAGFTEGYNVQRKKTPLPWDTPQKSNQIQRQDSFVNSENIRTRDTANYSSASTDSTAAALEHEREKLDQSQTARRTPQDDDRRLEEHLREKRLQTQTFPPANKPPPPQVGSTKAADFSRFQGSRPIEIVPISQKEYERHMEEGAWDPLHNRPFDSRNGSRQETEQRRSGRESSWSIRDEIMAKYDALTSLAMAKKTADVLRVNASNNPNLDTGHHPDTLKRKSGRKSKLIFIAE